MARSEATEATNLERFRRKAGFEAPATRFRLVEPKAEPSDQAGWISRISLRIGRGERIRTSDPSVPNRVLYQTEPRPDTSVNEHGNTAADRYGLSGRPLPMLSTPGVQRFTRSSASDSSRANAA